MTDISAGNELCVTCRSRRRIHIAARTKIELNPALCRKLKGLDDLARIFFPDNRNHRKAFVAIWIEIKYADGQFLPSIVNVSKKCALTSRSVEIARAKLRKMGIIQRISHFDPAHGYRAGWTFSNRFWTSMRVLGRALEDHRESSLQPRDRARDQQALLFV